MTKVISVIIWTLCRRVRSKLASYMSTFGITPDLPHGVGLFEELAPNLLHCSNTEEQE